MKNFIICLSKIEESLKTATNLKRQLDDFNMPAELFEGTYGSNAVEMMENEGRILHSHGIKGEINPSLPSAIKMLSPGVKGCFYSHYRLWQKCAELNEPIIIWEDDIVLQRSFILVDWEDILIVALGHPAKSKRYRQFLESPNGDPKAESYFQSSMPGCCGYAIKPHAAKKLLEVYQKTYLPADNAINVYYLNIQIHSYVMGEALIKKDGKKSLTRTKFWENYK
jgi:GR25 family glycosyltransferase involved in LPS biosynthesis